MNCKPENLENCKKISVVICSLILAIMAILGIIVINMNTQKAENNNLENNITNQEVEFSGPKYKPSTVYDESNKEVSLLDLSDKPMALIFFNTTNQESIEALEIFNKYQEEYSDKVNIVGICISDGVTENTEKTIKTLEESGIELKNILYDLDYSAKNEYNITTIPTLVFINKNKEIINTISKIEHINEDVITANLDILAENY